MDTRFLGRTGLRVSSLTLGTMTFGGTGYFEHVGQQQVDEARELVAMCIDAGVNTFDTADAYSLGRSEEILGEALAGRRDEVLIATKAHFRVGQLPNDVGWSRHHLIRACEASLRRLRTDYVDLYQIHEVDHYTGIEELVRSLDELVRSGKVRYVGCSNFSAWQLMKALAVADARGLERFSALQAYYSLVGRDLEHELLPLCLDQQVGILVWSPLAGGFLSGKFRRGEEPASGTRRAAIGGPHPWDVEQGFSIVDVLHEIADERHVSPAQVALNWVLARPGITSVVIGARTREQLADNLGAATWTLAADELALLDQASARPLPYPYWHQLRYSRERVRGVGLGAPWDGSGV